VVTMRQIFRLRTISSELLTSLERGLVVCDACSRVGGYQCL
jgi:hypothetical protein